MNEPQEVPARYYDEINELWGQAEQVLKRLRCPYKVAYLYETTPGLLPADGVVRKSLVWMRHDKGWHICHEESHKSRDKESFQYVPIQEAPFAVRLAMMAHFEALRAKVLKECENLIPRLDKAIAEFRRILGRRLYE